MWCICANKDEVSCKFINLPTGSKDRVATAVDQVMGGTSKIFESQTGRLCSGSTSAWEPLQVWPFPTTMFEEVHNVSVWTSRKIFWTSQLIVACGWIGWLTQTCTAQKSSLTLTVSAIGWLKRYGISAVDASLSPHTCSQALGGPGEVEIFFNWMKRSISFA